MVLYSKTGCYVLYIPARLLRADCGRTWEKQMQEVAGPAKVGRGYGQGLSAGTERGWMLPTDKQKWFYCHEQLKNCCLLSFGNDNTGCF